MNLALKLLPLVLFLTLAGFLAKGLTLDPAELPSPLIDKPAPEFTVELLPEGSGELASSSLDGKVWVLNVWASWCAPCVQEHPYIVELAEKRSVILLGLNYKDEPGDAQQWLGRLGNPFTYVLDDRLGDVGLDWGVYGVPETFVIDKLGRVRYKHVGPLDRASVVDKLIPLIDELEREPT